MFDTRAFLLEKGLISESTELRLDKLEGGYWNEVFRLRSAAFDWVLKRFFAEPSRERLFPILPESEALALKLLSPLGVTPKFVAFFPASETEQAVLLYDFAVGERLEGGFVQVAELFKRLHRFKLEAGVFRKLATHPQAILRQADALLADCNHALKSDLLALRPEPIAFKEVEMLSLVHTDAWQGNFIASAEQLVLIDWQCPGLGDPAEDVWTFLYSGFQQLIGLELYSAKQQALFLDAYADSAMQERLRKLEPFFVYRVAAHSLTRIQDLEKLNPEGATAYKQLVFRFMKDLSHA